MSDEPYRVAISGCRPPSGEHNTAETRETYARLVEDATRWVRGLAYGTVIVHGNAAGIDSVCRDEARKLGLLDEPHLPYPEAHGGNYRAALLARNAYVTTVSELHVWPAPWSRGTWDAVRKAKAAGIVVKFHEPFTPQRS